MNSPLSQETLQSILAADLAALPLIEKWVSFPSISRDSNLPLLQWTQDRLQALGVSCRLTYDDSGKKANLWATLPAADSTRWPRAG